MKKKFMLLIIASIMIVTFVSCEGDIFDSISNFMGGTSTNVLIDGEIVSVPTENIDALEDTLGLILGGEAEPEDPVTPEQAGEVRESVKKILESNGETEAAKGLLDDPVDDSEIPDEVKQAMEDLEDELGLNRGELEVKDKGDLAAAILLSDLQKKKDLFGPTPTPEQKEELVKDARVAIDFVKKVSGIGNIGVTTALTDLLEGLIDERAMSRMVSRTGRNPDDVDLDEIFNYVAPIFNMYYTLIDTNGTTGIQSEEVTAISSQYALLRKYYENMAPSLEGSGEEAKVSDLVHYISAVLISSNNQLIPDSVKNHGTYPTTFATLLNLAKEFVDSPDKEAYIDDVETDPRWFFIHETYHPAWENAFINYFDKVPTEPAGLTEKRYETIFNTVLALSGAIPGNTYITGELEIILNDLITEIEGEE